MLIDVGHKKGNYLEKPDNSQRGGNKNLLVNTFVYRPLLLPRG